MNRQLTASKNGKAIVEASPVLLQSLHLRNFLSFGPDTPELRLGALSLFIGANGSGKSNLIEAICLLRASPESLQDVVRRGGGVQEWIWKGKSREEALLSVVVTNSQQQNPLHHLIGFDAEGQNLRLKTESISSASLHEGLEIDNSIYEYNGDKRSVVFQGKKLPINLETFDPNASVLAQRRDPDQYPEFTYLASHYSKIKAYREWAFGRNTIFREPQRADMRNDRLEEDFSNLGLFLSQLRLNYDAKKALLRCLHDIYEGADDYEISIQGGAVQVFFTEGRFTIPATRLSDGTLRYLCLLAILCDPNPPPLICIEEPELGLHPDILPKIADLLVEASQRTQLIVTTHSDILVDAMTERPESVVVCEKHEGQTQIKRLSADDLGVWLDKYRLGQLWTRGNLGGTRW